MNGITVLFVCLQSINFFLHTLFLIETFLGMQLAFYAFNIFEIFFTQVLCNSLIPIMSQ